MYFESVSISLVNLSLEFKCGFLRRCATWLIRYIYFNPTQQEWIIEKKLSQCASFASRSQWERWKKNAHASINSHQLHAREVAWIQFVTDTPKHRAALTLMRCQIKIPSSRALSPREWKVRSDCLFQMSAWMLPFRFVKNCQPEFIDSLIF